MKKWGVISLSLVFFLFTGCGGKSNPARLVFADCQRWTAEEMDVFFDVHTKYLDYENSTTNMVGRIRLEGQDIHFDLSYDTAAQLYFETLDEENIWFALGRFKEAPDDYTYIVKIDNSKKPDILPNGTILTFIREDITEEELYMPEALGALEQSAA